MKTATITEAKNGLSALLDRVRSGETVLITDRGRAVARLEPVVTPTDATGRRERLERAGLARIGTAPPPAHRIHRPAPRLQGGTSAVQALLDERRTGR
jgi:prevent-host-death family protein